VAARNIFVTWHNTMRTVCSQFSGFESALTPNGWTPPNIFRVYELDMETRLYNSIFEYKALQDSAGGLRAVHKLPLTELLEKFEGYLCSDPRDSVYALLSLASDRNSVGQVIADYSRTCTDLFFDLLSKKPGKHWDIGTAYILRRELRLAHEEVASASTHRKICELYSAVGMGQDRRLEVLYTCKMSGHSMNTRSYCQCLFHTYKGDTGWQSTIFVLSGKALPEENDILLAVLGSDLKLLFRPEHNSYRFIGLVLPLEDIYHAQLFQPSQCDARAKATGPLLKWDSLDREQRRFGLEFGRRRLGFEIALSWDLFHLAMRLGYRNGGKY
jgi:hypothetical protein